MKHSLFLLTNALVRDRVHWLRTQDGYVSRKRLLSKPDEIRLALARKINELRYEFFRAPNRAVEIQKVADMVELFKAITCLCPDMVCHSIPFAQDIIRRHTLRPVHFDLVEQARLNKLRERGGYWDLAFIEHETHPKIIVS